MPAAIVVVDTSSDTGAASSRASAASAAAPRPIMPRASSGPSSARRRVASPENWPASSFWNSLVGRGEDLGQGQPRGIQRHRQRDDVEVGDRDNDVLVDDHHRVVTGRVELDPRLFARVGQNVAHGAVHLWDAAEAQRVLQLPWRLAVEQTAARQQGPQAIRRRDQTRVWPVGGELRVEHREVGGEPVEAERNDGVVGVEQHPRVVERQCAPGGAGCLHSAAAVIRPVQARVRARPVRGRSRP